MMKLTQYPQIDCSKDLRNQIVLLQNIEWPSEIESKIENIIWPENPEIHKTSFVFKDNNKVICHVAVVGKDLVHNGEVYKAFGLSEVVTHPEYRNQEVALQLIKKAFIFIKEHNADISIFTCKPSLIDFYSKGGWSYREDICLVGGTRGKPFRSDSLGLATMTYFFSEKAKYNEKKLKNTDIYLEIGEKQLW